MKNIIRVFLLLLFISFTASCASVQSDSGLYTEKKQNQKKLLFEDWKYKGFGQPLPVWFEAAYSGDAEGVQKKVSELAGREIIILTAQGINSDQADKSLKMKLSELSVDFILYDSSWALLGEKAEADGIFEYPYLAAAVLYK